MDDSGLREQQKTEVVAKAGIGTLSEILRFAQIVVAKAGIGTLSEILRFAQIVVAKAGIEPATHGFSVRCSTN
jgi:hypothetical protein